MVQQKSCRANCSIVLTNDLGMRWFCGTHAIVFRGTISLVQCQDGACAVPRWFSYVHFFLWNAMTFVEFAENRWQVSPKSSRTWFPNSIQVALETLVPKLREYVQHRCHAKTGNPRALWCVPSWYPDRKSQENLEDEFMVYFQIFWIWDNNG